MAADFENLNFSEPDACPVPVRSGIAGGPRRSPSSCWTEDANDVG